MTRLDHEPTIPALVRALAERHGHKPLVVMGRERLSYVEADAESSALARGLLAAGVGKGTRVGLLMPNGPDWVVAWLAAARIGALVAPLNTFSQARELKWALEFTDCAVLLMKPRHLGHDYEERLETIAPELEAAHSTELFLPSLPFLRRVYVWGESDRRWAGSSPDALRALLATHRALDDPYLRKLEKNVSPADPTLLVLSSGSSGDPKGAVHTHGTLVRHSKALNAHRRLNADDRMYSPMPFFWVGGLVYSLLACMHEGATLLCEESFEPGKTLDMLERERATIAVGWAHYAKSMAEHPSFRARDLSSLHGGNLWAILPDAVRPADSELRSNSLGMTETCGPHCYDNMDHDLPEALRGSFGHAVEGIEHKVVEPQTGATVGTGEVGEICVRGPDLMQGLYKLEREQVFDHEGWYRTGDSGYFDADGVLFFQGRLGELIKTGGANVTPREVEVALESFAEVKEAYVVGLPDSSRGEIVVAAVVLQAGQSVGSQELKARLKKDLSAYKVPRKIAIFASGTLPMTTSGKVDKTRLKALLTRSAP